MTEIDLSYGMLDRMVGLELRKAQSLAGQTFLNVLDGHILPGHFTILVLIAENPGQSQSKIAEAAGLDRSSLVPILRQFEKADLINRIPARNDRRSKTMAIRPKGKALIEKYTPEIQKLEDMVMQGMGTENYENFIELLLQFQDLISSKTK